MRLRVTVLLVVALHGAAFTRARAQHSLADAIRLADRAAVANRIAAGSAIAQAAHALSPLAGILPSVHVEAGYARTSDPIGVFGTTLRQRAITQANFDPARLNYPGDLGNYQGGVVVEQPIVNADAWAGRAALRHSADAASASETWTRLSTRLDVVRAYFGVAFATERVATLRGAARAANAHVSQADAMVRQGLVTKSDALLAAVRMGDVEADLVEAIGGVETAERQLAVLLGGDGRDRPRDLAATLPSAERIRAVVAGDTAVRAGDARADVQAATLGLAAAQGDVQRARAAYLPRVNSFARYDWNASNRPFAGAGNWTVGVMTSWMPFASATEVADTRMAAGRAASAMAQADGAAASARVDIARTRTDLAVALARLAIAERAVAASSEAHRIVARKYAGGLATVVELLDAHAQETRSALALAGARYASISAAAERRRALGGDPASLEALDSASATAATAAIEHIKN